MARDVDGRGPRRPAHRDPRDGDRTADAVLSLGVTVVGGALAWAVLKPTVGFDDANITMNYAENIARGHGYVFFVGGERVEGSSSPLWTLLNTLSFLLFDRIEGVLAALGALVAAATIFLATRTARLLAGLIGCDARSATIAAGAGFLLFPAYFGWTVWSLMDIGLWVLLLTALTQLAVRAALPPEHPKSLGASGGAAFVAAALATTVARPEGIAAAVAASVIVAASSHAAGRDRRAISICAAVGAALLLAALTGLRLWYFGQPLPNTFYAKVSINYLEQIRDGLEYAGSYLSQPLNFLLVLLWAVGGLVREPPETTDAKAYRNAWAGCGVLLAGGALVYVVLGGDHFGSHRFLQFVTPVALPFAAIAVVLIGRNLRLAPRRRGAALLLPAFALVYAWIAFSEIGGLRRQFRFAEKGRAVGERLSDLPGRPSLGVMAAGGISMTFDGPIYDLMGLNWVEMAHAARDHPPHLPANHAAFSKPVFYRTLPDIVLPISADCSSPPESHFAYVLKVVDGLPEDPEFKALYRPACENGVFFYKRLEFGDGEGGTSGHSATSAE